MREANFREQFNNIPAELVRDGYFCCWRYEERKERKTKIPYKPISGDMAKSNEKSTFGSFEQVMNCLEKHEYDGAGIGIFEGVCAIDLDHCIDQDGNISKSAMQIVELMHSYTEISPGGDGIHILFKAKDFIYDTKKYYIMNHNAGIEVYVTGVTSKYVTVTGKRIARQNEYGERSEELNHLLDDYMIRTDKETDMAGRAINAINAVNTPDEDEILQIALNSRNGQVFSSLWNGDIGLYPSHSEADMALCSHLAFWTGCDAGMMDRMFRRSGLMRPKWDDKRPGGTYGTHTIQRAIASCNEIYAPKRSAIKTIAGDDQKEENRPTEDVKAKGFSEVIPLKPEASNLPRFPVECLPSMMMEYVNAVAEHSQTSPDMAAVIGLGVLASCLQGKYQVEGTLGYTEQLSLYVAVIASPGERKSSVLRDMTCFIEAYEKEKNEKLEPLIRENKRERDALERRIAMLEKKLEKKPDASTERELVAMQDQLEEFQEIKKIRYCADDCSIEALTSLLAKNSGRMTVISTEGGIFDIMSGRYSSKPNLDVWLKAHCGDTIRVDRLNREVEYIPHPALTAILSIQPIVVNEIMENPAMTGRGLIARFLYSSPPSQIGKRVFCSKPIPDETEDKYKNMVYRLMELPVSDEAKTIRLSAEATELISDYFMAHEEYLSGEGQEISDWANKYIGCILRIAALIHLAENEDDTSDISGQTLRNAIEIGKYFLAHVRYAYALMGNDLSLKKANFVLGKIRKNNFTIVKRSDLFQVCRGKFYKKTEDLFPILELLEAHGFLRIERPVYTGTGRPSDAMVIVNTEALH